MDSWIINLAHLPCPSFVYLILLKHSGTSAIVYFYWVFFSIWLLHSSTTKEGFQCLLDGSLNRLSFCYLLLWTGHSICHHFWKISCWLHRNGPKKTYITRRSKVHGRRERGQISSQARSLWKEASCCISKIANKEEQDKKKLAALPEQNNDKDTHVNEETASEELASENMDSWQQLIWRNHYQSL